MRRAAALLLATAAACSGREPPSEIATLQAPVYDDAFAQVWRDGRAELAGYDLVTPRYDELRHGVAVTIFVTEDFADGPRVKADPGKHPEHQVFPVLKLNLMKDFSTGIYDYNLMTSAFIALAPVHERPAGFATKVAFSAQEWCGMTYQQVAFDRHAVRSSSHSYFDGEADKNETLAYPDTGMASEALYAWARGLAAPVLGPGESRQVRLLRGLETVRLRHQPLVWERATLSRLPDKATIEVRGTSYEVDVLTAHVEGGDTTTFYVETAPARRIVKWLRSNGEVAELVKSDRLTYWELNGAGKESYLERLGLTPRRPLTP
ncbi:MAG: hypothetical protein ACAI38_07400 [Myxococcota bacterium]